MKGDPGSVGGPRRTAVVRRIVRELDRLAALERHLEDVLVPAAGRIEDEPATVGGDVHALGGLVSRRHRRCRARGDGSLRGNRKRPDVLPDVHDGVGQRLAIGREADAVYVQTRGQPLGRAGRLPRGAYPDPVDVAAPPASRDKEKMGAVARKHGAVIEMTVLGKPNRLPAFHRYRPQRGVREVEY